MTERNSLYATYAAMKGWADEPAKPEPHTFANLVSLAGLKAHKLDILDYGFGRGDFLDWARGMGHVVSGIEILPDSIEQARARGHVAYSADLAEQTIAIRSVDLIIAIDVLEHLDLSGFAAFLGLASRALKPGGRIVARFPNGDSPFFGRYQYSDFTHDKPISSRAVRQIIMPHGFELMRTANPRPVPSGLMRGMKVRASYLLRDLVESAIGLTYYGYRTPLDPNVVVVLGRISEKI